MMTQRSTPIRMVQRILNLTVLFFVGEQFLSTAYAAPSTYNIKPVQLDNNYELVGSITTDGTRGLLTNSNILQWNLIVTQTTDTVFTEKNTNSLNISQVSSDGANLLVPASPDGFSDGGNLSFLNAPSPGGIPVGALVADFSGYNITGGVSGWQTPFALNYFYLNQPDGTTYVAATAQKGKRGTFTITPVLINPPPNLISMFGTIKTDGKIGALSPQNFKSWRIVGREQQINSYSETNSTIINLLDVYADKNLLWVATPTGNFQIGIPSSSPRGRPIIVTIADFTNQDYPMGVTSFYYGFQGLVGAKTPLTQSAKYTVARR